MIEIEKYRIPFFGSQMAHGVPKRGCAVQLKRSALRVNESLRDFQPNRQLAKKKNLDGVVRHRSFQKLLTR